MRLGEWFESAHRPSVLFVLALRHRGRKASNYTFGEGSELEHDELASMHNCIRLEGLTFHAELSTNGAKRLELTRT
jgi:hypothetical protein